MASATCPRISTRQVGRSFTGSLTLTVSGLICVPTASSLLIAVRRSKSKRARLIATWRSRRWKLAWALLYPVSTNRGGKHRVREKASVWPRRYFATMGRISGPTRTAQNVAPSQAGGSSGQQNPKDRGGESRCARQTSGDQNDAEGRWPPRPRTARCRMNYGRASEQ